MKYAFWLHEGMCAKVVFGTGALSYFLGLCIEYANGVIGPVLFGPATPVPTIPLDPVFILLFTTLLSLSPVALVAVALGNRDASGNVFRDVCAIRGGIEAVCDSTVEPPGEGCTGVQVRLREASFCCLVDYRERRWRWEGPYLNII
jgi:hypothetical protein